MRQAPGIGDAVAPPLTQVVDIRLHGNPAHLEMPTRAVTDGSDNPVYVETRPFTYRFRRARIAVPVDAKTARHFVRYERLVLLLSFVTVPVIIFTIVAFFVGQITTRHSAAGSAPPFMTPGDVVAISVTFGVLTILTLTRRPRQYPRMLVPRGAIIARADRDAAMEWAALNPPETMTLHHHTRH